MQRLALFVSMVLCIAAARASADDVPVADRAAAVVTTVERTAVALTRDGLPADRAAALLQSLQNNIDFEAIAQITLGKYWTAAGNGERQDFLIVLRRLLVDKIVRRATGRKAGSLRILSHRLLDGGDLLLSTRRTAPEERAIVIDWRLHQTGSSLRIVDIVVDGWSVATSARQDFFGQLNLNGGSVGLLTVTLRDRLLRPF
jgi:ABC-type transporter MlaC component